MRIGIVGCGFTADHYMPSLKRYPNLELVAVTDRDTARATAFSQHFGVPQAADVNALLADPSIEMIVNLTSSFSHYEVSRAALQAGKHVYSEKPVAAKFEEALELVDLARDKGLYYSAAPCSLLGDTAQTLWRALRNREVGDVKLVYAELDDGPLHLSQPQTWSSPSGAPYDYEEEFAAGVTMEHASYYLTWFAAFFGPVRSIQSFAATVWPERPLDGLPPLKISTPDISVAILTYASGTIVRLTCGLVAPYNHVMRIVGDQGVLRVDECWNYNAPVYRDNYSITRFKAERYPITKTLPPIAHYLAPGPRTIATREKRSWRKRTHRYRTDFARGISDLASAIVANKRQSLPPDFCLHVTEILLAIQNGPHPNYTPKTTFAPLEPLSDTRLREYQVLDW